MFLSNIIKAAELGLAARPAACPVQFSYKHTGYQKSPNLEPFKS